MSKTSLCLKVARKDGEKAIVLTSKLKLIDKGLKIQRDGVYIHVPLTRLPSPEELEKLKENIPSFEVSEAKFLESKKPAKTFLELLETKLPPHLLASIPRAIDFVGDIAIIEVPPELETYKMEIGNAILQTHKNVRTVLAKAGAVTGTYRLRKFEVIAGENKTETIHKEHGCKYYLDIAKAYFSPRLSYEHHRVASQVKEGETVIDMFAGVGPFSVLIAKTHEKVKVYAIDINPEAVAFLKKNIKANRVEGKVNPIMGDAKQIIEQALKGIADRVIMNLPEKAIEFVEAACKALKTEGGTIHFYSFVKASDSLESLRECLEKEVEKFGKKVEKILFSRFVRETAPYEWQAVLDVKIR
ncbi:MAG: class I SAM-dependent methyltransferase family protein [Nitrososphaerota archaeon]|nr:class I SAM-dependent methyltransferase family protein [Candidatus Bathyarchaeota archaeon]MDW8024152.1 class I SAM-dependent methyltransferase family protein [Nitrososphaerota archaeon]